MLWNGCTLAFLAISHVGFAANPFVPSIYTADPSARVFNDGRLYVYPSHDMDPPKGCDLMDRYHVFSTADMVNWRDEGQILEASQVPWGRSEGGFMWAPDCVYRNGTYYFYFPHPSGTKWNDTWKIGVATSKSPVKDFHPLPEPIKGLEGHGMIDPAVFIDDDGQAYLYFGGGGHCSVAKLKPNMVEVDGPVVDMQGLDGFHEGTWVFKRKGTYYLTYADSHHPNNELSYATSDHPLGPWTSHGSYLKQNDCHTSHGSVVEYKGQWYAFYHNASLSGGNPALRSICVDKLDFNPDGSIQVVKQTKEGPAAVGPAPTPNPARMVCDLKAANFQGGASLADGPAEWGGRSVHNLLPSGAGVGLEKVDGGKGGRATIEIVYAAIDRARLKLYVNGRDWSFLNCPLTGGWNNYTGHASLTVPLQAGKTNTIKFEGGYGGVNLGGVAVIPLDD